MTLHCRLHLYSQSFHCSKIPCFPKIRLLAHEWYFLWNPIPEAPLRLPELCFHWNPDSRRSYRFWCNMSVHPHPARQRIPFLPVQNRSESLSLHAPPAYSWTWSLPLWFRVLPVHLPVYWHHLPSLSLSAVSGTVKI